MIDAAHATLFLPKIAATATGGSVRSYAQMYSVMRGESREIVIFFVLVVLVCWCQLYARELTSSTEWWELGLRTA